MVRLMLRVRHWVELRVLLLELVDGRRTSDEKLPRALPTELLERQALLVR